MQEANKKVNSVVYFANTARPFGSCYLPNFTNSHKINVSHNNMIVVNYQNIPLTLGPKYLQFQALVFPTIYPTYIPCATKQKQVL